MSSYKIKWKSEDKLRVSLAPRVKTIILEKKESVRDVPKTGVCRKPASVTDYTIKSLLQDQNFGDEVQSISGIKRKIGSPPPLVPLSDGFLGAQGGNSIDKLSNIYPKPTPSPI